MPPPHAAAAAASCRRALPRAAAAAKRVPLWPAECCCPPPALPFFERRVRNVQNSTTVDLSKVSLQYWFEGPAELPPGTEAAPWDFFSAQCEYSTVGEPLPGSRRRAAGAAAQEAAGRHRVARGWTAHCPGHSRGAARTLISPAPTLPAL